MTCEFGTTDLLEHVVKHRVSQDYILRAKRLQFDEVFSK